MNASDPSEHHEGAPHPPPGTDNTGVLVLGLLAIAAFCGWYLIVRDRASDTKPLPVVQKPIMPPSTTDTSAEFPGHKHYRVLSPLPDQADATKQR